MSSRITVEQTNRTIICSVVFVDLVEYSKRPVGEQMAIKDRFTALLADALKDIALGDRIVLDTGDGAAMSFLGDPEDALFVAMTLRDALKDGGPGRAAFRIGINLGPVRLVRDINGQPNIVGDGINVAQRIMSFSEPGQLLVSRSYYDAVSCLAEEYGKLFRYDGSRTDKHVRDHDVYVVGDSESAFTRAKTGMQRRAAQTSPNLKPVFDGAGAAAARAASAAPGAARPRKALIAFLRDRTKVNVAGAALGVLVVALTAVLVIKPPPVRPAAASPHVAAAVAEGTAGQQVTTAAKGEETKSVAARAQAAPGTLVLAVAPWGEVFVNGKSRGLTPPVKNLKLAPGTYKIEIRNTKFPARVETVRIKSRETVTVRHEFKK